jgi:hypothetical protein
MGSFLKEYNPSSPIPPIRIIGDTTSSILDPENAFESMSEVVEMVQDAVTNYRQDAETCFLAARRTKGRHSFFALDLNNASYDYDTAHLCLAPIPVYVLRLSRKPKIYRRESGDQTVAWSIAELHRLHGRDPLPFFDDYTKLIACISPRDLKS